MPNTDEARTKDADVEVCLRMAVQVIPMPVDEAEKCADCGQPKKKHKFYELDGTLLCPQSYPRPSYLSSVGTYIPSVARNGRERLMAHKMCDVEVSVIPVFELHGCQWVRAEAFTGIDLDLIRAKFATASEILTGTAVL